MVIGIWVKGCRCHHLLSSAVKALENFRDRRILDQSLQGTQLSPESALPPKKTPTPVQENDAQCLNFEGPWTPDQRRRVSAAVEDFETIHREGPFSGECPSWVCVLHDFESTRLLCAHRTHLPTVLSAATAGDLAQAIRGAANERTGFSTR